MKKQKHKKDMKKNDDFKGQSKYAKKKALQRKGIFSRKSPISLVKGVDHGNN